MPEQVDLQRLYTHAPHFFNTNLPMQNVTQIDMEARRVEYLKVFDDLAAYRVTLAEDFRATLNRDHSVSDPTRTAHWYGTAANNIVDLDRTPDQLVRHMAAEGHQFSKDQLEHVYYKRSVDIQESTRAQNIVKEQEQSRDVAVGIFVVGEARTQSAAAEIRDSLLGQSLDIMTEWRTALGRASSDDERSELGSFYKNQLGVLNGAFDAIRATDSTIETRIDIDQVERTVEQQAQVKNTPHYGETEWRLTMANEPSALEAPQFHNASEKTLYIEQLAELRNSLTDGISTSEEEDYYESAEAELLEKLEANHSMELSAQGWSVAEVERLSGELARAELSQMERQNPGASGAELLAKYEGQMEQEVARSTELFQAPSQPDFGRLLAEQAADIRAEWQHDLDSGRHNQHALESYFAGKIDQHNSLIEMAVQAHPELQQSLPPTINYITLRDELQHHIEAAKAQQVSVQPELAAAGYGVSI